MRLFTGLAGCIVLVSTFLGCSDSPERKSALPEKQAVTTAVATDSAAHSQTRSMALWARSCALCHVDGNAGAPIVGVAEQWLPRLSQGRDVLLRHTIEGLNAMPPLGYCMACEEADFLAMIDFMTAGLEAEGNQ